MKPLLHIPPLLNALLLGVILLFAPDPLSADETPGSEANPRPAEGSVRLSPAEQRIQARDQRRSNAPQPGERAAAIRAEAAAWAAALDAAEARNRRHAERLRDEALGLRHRREGTREDFILLIESAENLLMDSITEHASRGDTAAEARDHMQLGLLREFVQRDYRAAAASYLDALTLDPALTSARQRYNLYAHYLK